MKKFVAAFAMFLAFTAASIAQEQKMTNEEKAKIEAYQLSEKLGLTGKKQEEFMTLLMQKHQTIDSPKMSTERKTEMTRIVDERLRAILTPEQLRKLEGHPHLLNTSAQAAPKTR